MVHFAEPSLCGYKTLYDYNNSWTRCKKFHKGLIGPDTITTNWKQVTCQYCIKYMTCEHDWKYLYTGRHGSDKGDEYFECKHCKWFLNETSNWNPKRNLEYIEWLLENLDEEDSLELIHSGFKVYQWNI